MLFAPITDISVKTGFGQVRIAKDAVVLVMHLKKGMAVYDFHDGRRGDVVVCGGRRSFVLGPGRSLILADAAVAEMGDVSPVACIGYRAVAVRRVAPGVNAISSEFSLMSGLAGVGVFGRMRRSGLARDARIMRRMIKSAAIIAQIRPGSEQFQRIARTRL